MQFEDITLTVTDGIGTITLNRPGTSNSVRPQTMREMCAAIDALTADDDCAVLVLRAEGKNFSGGADYGFLDDLTGMTAIDIRTHVYAYFQGAVRRFYQCPKPTIALVQGIAVTVGCELALAADFRIAAEDAVFIESWIKLGIMPPLGGTFLLPRLVGLGRAAEMVLRGKPVKAEEALRIGLVSEVVARDALETRGLDLATELRAAAPIAYRVVKDALHRGLETSIEAEWSANLSSQAVLLGSDDFKEGVRALKGRRAPQFKGH